MPLFAFGISGTSGTFFLSLFSIFSRGGWGAGRGLSSAVPHAYTTRTRACSLLEVKERKEKKERKKEHVGPSHHGDGGEVYTPPSPLRSLLPRFDSPFEATVQTEQRHLHAGRGREKNSGWLSLLHLRLASPNQSEQAEERRTG